MRQAGISLLKSNPAGFFLHPRDRLQTIAAGISTSPIMRHRPTFFSGLVLLVALHAAPAWAEVATQPATEAAETAFPRGQLVAAAERLVASIYKDELASSQISVRLELARKLLKQGIETRDDTAARYVLLRDARDMATALGDAATACRAIDLLSREYRFNVSEAKLTALVGVARAPQLLNGGTPLIQCALGLADSAIELEDYDLAVRAATLAESTAGKCKVVGLVLAAQDRQREARGLMHERDTAEASLVSLRHEPADGAARLSAGRYLCLARGQWQKGLPLLAGAGDQSLSPLASQELAGAQDAQAQLQLANGWWDAGDRTIGVQRRQARLHACEWYRRAAPQLTGLSREVAQRRLGECEAGEWRRAGYDGGLTAELFADKTFTKRVLMRVDSQVNFDWGADAPAEDMPHDDFSIRWTGKLRIAKSGKYTFVLTAGSARMRLGDQMVVDNPKLYLRRNGERFTLDLKEGFHPLCIEYWVGSGQARVQLAWIPPGAAREEVLPAEVLFHDLGD